MNKIQRIQKLFNTDKWLGRTLLILFLYIIYISICYLLIPFLIMFIQNFNFGGIGFFIFLFLIAPIFSYYIPFLILKIFKINKFLLYLFHTILIILIPFSLIIFILSNMYLNFGGF